MQPSCIGQKLSEYFSVAGCYPPRALAAEATPAFHVPELRQAPAALAAWANRTRWARRNRGQERTLSGRLGQWGNAGGVNHAANQLLVNAA